MTSEKQSSEEIGEEYYNSLTSLTFNSRPIIQSHTAIAQENTDAASEITKAIEKRIQKAIPTQKLYVFYLMDSICKNVGVPYTAQFSSNLPKNFTSTYSLVDDQTRQKLIDLFKTWKVPNPVTGMPLFNNDGLNQIEKFIIKATANNRSPDNIRNSSPDNIRNSPLPPNATLNGGVSTVPLTTDGIIREIDDLKNLVNSRLLQVPNDSKTRERYTTLQQLRTIVCKGGLEISQLETVKTQLSSLREAEVMKLNAFKIEQQQMIQQQQQQQLRQQVPTLTVGQLQGLLNPGSQPLPTLQGGSYPGQQLQQTQKPPLNISNAQWLFAMMDAVLKQKQVQMAPIPVAQVPPAPSFPSIMPTQQPMPQLKPQPVPQLQPQSNPSTSSGSLLSANNLHFLKGILERAQSTAPNSAGSSSVEPSTARYELNQNFLTHHQSTSEDINLLYPSNSTQCSNCAQRFYNTAAGQHEKNLHLDWHFRTNKKLKSSSKQINNRAWFLTISQWVEFKDDELVGYANSGSNEEVPINGNINGRLTASGPLIEEELEKRIVQIPQDSDNEVICGTCRDKLVGVFDDDSGEWIWKNAIKVKGKVYHYSCWIETKGKRDRERSPERS